MIDQTSRSNIIVHHVIQQLYHVVQFYGAAKFLILSV